MKRTLPKSDDIWDAPVFSETDPRDHLVREGERVDDLQRNGCVILQDRTKFCFGMDAVLLSGFADVREGEHVLDLCSGNGIVAILTAAKTKAARVDALELQEDIADMAARSVLLNHMEDRVHVKCGDLKEAAGVYGRAVFDAVICNPPYMNSGHGLTNPSSPRALARHEIACTFRDVAEAAAALLKVGGRLYLVHRPHRLIEILGTLKENGLEPKRMKFVHPFREAEANMVLIEAVHGGGAWLKAEPPIIVYEKPGVYTEEIREIYGY